MKRPPGCSCHCPVPGYPDCFGCIVLEISIPSAWQMDFPSTLSYLGSTTGSCYGEVNGLGQLNSFGGRHRIKLWHDFEYPDVTDFGVGTILELDAALQASPYFGLTECVWGSNTVQLYETAARNGIDQLSTSMLTCGDIGPSIITGSYMLQDPWWANRPAWASDVFGGISPNRVRTIINPTYADCGVYPPGCGDAQAVYTCGIRVFGIYASLRVIDNKFRVQVNWSPRRNTITERWDNDSMTNESRWRRRFGTAQPGNAAIPYLAGSSCPSSIYPYADDPAQSDANYGSAIIYEKAINCETDFDGSPVVLTKVSETQHVGASQPVLAANGVTGVPSTITITPL